MCSVIILRRSAHKWPILIGANRDEMKDRLWEVPDRHWPDRPHVVAGLDQEAGGTWLGVNDDGLVACILNRHGTLGGHPDYRSRGELPLEALDHAEALDAAESLANLNPEAYRPFNLIVADHQSAWWLKNDGARIQTHEIPEGLSMISAHDLNDTARSDRIRLHWPRFLQAPVPDPDIEDWMGWQALLGSRKSLNDSLGAMQIETDMGFETVSSSLIALPKLDFKDPKKPVWLFNSDKPSDGAFFPIEVLA